MSLRYHILNCLIAITFSSCNSQHTNARGLNPDEFQKGLAGVNAQLVDLRAPAGYDEKHIMNAKNINLDAPDFDQQLNDLDKTKPIYFYCNSGERAGKAADLAGREGF